MSAPRHRPALSTAQVSGVLIGAAPAVLALLVELGGGAHPWTLAWPTPIALLAYAGLLVAGQQLFCRPRLASGLTAASGVSAVLVLAPRLATRPGLSLLLAVVAAGVWLALWLAVWRRPGLTRELLDLERELQLQVVALLGFASWCVVELGQVGSALTGDVLVLLSSATALALSLRWALRAPHPGWRRTALLVPSFGALAGALILQLSGQPPLWPLGLVTAAPLTLTGWKLAGLTQPEGRAWWAPLLDSPARILVSTFSLLCLLGTLLLVLPSSDRAGQGWSFVDAAFTAVSAVCVTGLIVRSTPHELSLSGQIIALGLIQLGGLGIMTLSTAALARLGRRLSLRHELAMARLFSSDDQAHLFAVLRRLLWFSLICEALGTALLWPLFAGTGEGAGPALWRALFTSVSAFCNAGFALQDDSLVGFNEQPLLLHTVASLIILGGLSPLAALALPAWLRGRRLSLQAKLILVVTATLLLSGAVLYLVLEWSHSLSGLGFWDKLHNAWFQSVTARTAGFNSVELGATQATTQTLMETLMFVGGSPGGTAGGIKTTTLAVLVISVLATLRGQPAPRVLGRQLSPQVVRKAWSIAFIALVMVGAAFFALQLTQALPSDAALFEVVSALGTVGLSLDLTHQLDAIGKLLIMACMFAGRVGPLSLFLMLARGETGDRIALPTEDVEVG